MAPTVSEAANSSEIQEKSSLPKSPPKAAPTAKNEVRPQSTELSVSRSPFKTV